MSNLLHLLCIYVENYFQTQPPKSIMAYRGRGDFGAGRGGRNNYMGGNDG